MQRIRVALAQFAPKLGVFDDNLARHLDWIAAARREGTELLVFPELSLTGYQLKDLVDEIAITPAALLQAFSACGAGPAIEVVAGFMERIPGAPSANAYAHLRIDEHGQASCLHLHRKLNLPTYGMFEEERFFARGRTLRAYDSPLLGRAGLLICEDFWHAANPLLLALDGPELVGARILIVGSDSPARDLMGEARTTPGNAEQWDLLARYTALTANCAVLVTHRVGVEDGLVFAGGSQIVLPGGGELCRAEFFKETMLKAELPLERALRRTRSVPSAGPQDDFERLSRELARLSRTYLEA